MNQRLRASFTLGLILTGGFTKLCQGAPTDSPEANPTITMHVYNYADVSPKTLIEAEKIAAGVFRKAGVETRWLDNFRLNQPDFSLTTSCSTSYRAQWLSTSP